MTDSRHHLPSLVEALDYPLELRIGHEISVRSVPTSEEDGGEILRADGRNRQGLSDELGTTGILHELLALRGVSIPILATRIYRYFTSRWTCDGHIVSGFSEGEVRTRNFLEPGARLVIPCAIFERHRIRGGCDEEDIDHVWSKGCKVNDSVGKTVIYEKDEGVTIKGGIFSHLC